jgi:hypothetical protein
VNADKLLSRAPPSLYRSKDRLPFSSALSLLRESALYSLEVSSMDTRLKRRFGNQLLTNYCPIRYAPLFSIRGSSRTTILSTSGHDQSEMMLRVIAEAGRPVVIHSDWLFQSEPIAKPSKYDSFHLPTDPLSHLVRESAEEFFFVLLRIQKCYITNQSRSQATMMG